MISYCISGIKKRKVLFSVIEVVKQVTREHSMHFNTQIQAQMAWHI